YRLESFGKSASVSVVFVESFGRLFKGDQPGGCENTDLAHTAAEPFPPCASLSNERLGADQHRPDRRSEAFRQAELGRIAMTCEIGNARIKRDGRVEDTRSVEVDRNAESVSTVADLLAMLSRHHGS